MAATWSVVVTVTNLAEKRATIVGVRTDGEDVRTYTVNTFWDTEGGQTFEEFKAAVQAGVWSAFEKDQTKRDTVAAFVGDAESSIAAWLDQQEVS